MTTSDLYKAWKGLKRQASGVVLMEDDRGYLTFGDDAYALARAVNDKPIGRRVEMRHAGDFSTARIAAADLDDVLAAIVAAGGAAAVAARVKGATL